MPAHIHGRHDLATSVTGKMWCRILCCGEVLTYYGTSNKAGKTRACEHLLSICAHMLVHTSTLYAEGKIQLFVCLGGFSTSVTTFAHSKKKSFSYLKHTHANNKGLIQLVLYLYFLVKEVRGSVLHRANKCLSWLQTWQDDVKGRTINSVCTCGDWGVVRTKRIVFMHSHIPRSYEYLRFLILHEYVVVCVWMRHMNRGAVNCPH